MKIRGNSEIVQGSIWLTDWRVWIVIISSIIGATAKFIGGYFYGSKALLVDALTSLANLVALIATIYYYSKTHLPSDLDHHFGHHRLGFAGALVTVTAYSFVAGLVVTDLLYTKAYSVEINAPILALVGLIFYSISIYTSRRISEYFGPYSIFTVSELLESTTVIIASLLGYLYTYIVDYVGAIVIVLYLFYELQGTLRDLIRLLSDVAPPMKLVEEARKTIEKHGVRVERIRLRLVKDGFYQGDITIRLPRDIIIEEAHRIADTIERELRNKYNMDVTIHIEPYRIEEKEEATHFKHMHKNVNT